MVCLLSFPSSLCCCCFQSITVLLRVVIGLPHTSWCCLHGLWCFFSLCDICNWLGWCWLSPLLINIIDYYWLLLYSTIFSSWADTLRSRCMWFWMMTGAFLTVNFECPPSGGLTALFGCYMVDATWNCCCLSSHSVYSVYTIQPCTSLQCQFIWSYIRRVHLYLAVTWHLHFWQNGWDLLHATVVHRGGTDTEIIRVNTESWPWRRPKKLLLLLPGLEHATFQSQVLRGTTELSPFHRCSLTKMLYLLHSQGYTEN